MQDRTRTPQVDRREPGASEVLVSGTVKDLVAGSGLTFEARGAHELSGIPGEWHLYSVIDQEPSQASDAAISDRGRDTQHQ